MRTRRSLEREGRKRARVRSSRLALAALGAAFAALVAFPSSVRAHTARNFVSPGLLTGFAGKLGEGIVGALGGELDYTHYPWEPYGMGFGGFFQVSSVAFDHVRVAFGPQMNVTVFGGELGLFVEEADSAHATSLGLQMTPFISIGFLALGFRVAAPFYGAGSAPRHAVDLGMSISVKYPIPLGGDYITFP